MEYRYGPVLRIRASRNWLANMTFGDGTQAFQATDCVFYSFSELLIMAWAESPTLGFLTAPAKAIIVHHGFVPL